MSQSKAPKIGRLCKIQLPKRLFVKNTESIAKSAKSENGAESVAGLSRF